MFVEYAADKHFNMRGSSSNIFNDYRIILNGMSTKTEKKLEEDEFMVSNRIVIYK